MKTHLVKRAGGVTSCGLSPRRAVVVYSTDREKVDCKSCLSNTQWLADLVAGHRTLIEISEKQDSEAAP